MIPSPKDIVDILRGVGSAEFPWKDPTLGTLLQRAASEIETLRKLLAETVGMLRRETDHSVPENEWDRVVDSYDEAHRG